MNSESIKKPVENKFSVASNLGHFTLLGSVPFILFNQSSSIIFLASILFVFFISINNGFFPAIVISLLSVGSISFLLFFPISEYIYLESSRILFSIFVLFLFIFTILNRKIHKLGFYYPNSLPIRYLTASIAVVTSYIWRVVDAQDAAFFIANSGEDNAEWMTGLAANIGADGLIFHPFTTYSGGKLTGVFATLVQFIFNVASPTAITYVDNLLILKLIFGIVVIFYSVVCSYVPFLIATKVKQNSTFRHAYALAMLSSVVGYCSITMLLINGHLPPALSLLLVISAFLLSFIKEDQSLLALLLISSILFFFATLGWAPIFIPFLLYIIFLLLALLAYKSQEKERSINELPIAPIVILGLCFLSLFWLMQRLPGLSNLSFDRYADYIQIDGGVTSTGMILASATLLLPLLTKIFLDFKSSHRFITQFSVMHFVAVGFTATIFILYFLSYLTSPTHVPHYATYKMLIVFQVLAIPIMFCLLPFLVFIKYPRNLSISIFLIFGVLGINGVPMSLLAYPNNFSNQSKAWVPELIKTAEANPNKILVCVQVLPDVPGAAAYECTRFAGGLLGYQSDKEQRGWAMSALTGRSLDPIDTEYYLNEKDFFSQLAVVKLDDEFKLTGDPKVDGYLFPLTKYNDQFIQKQISEDIKYSFLVKSCITNE